MRPAPAKRRVTVHNRRAFRVCEEHKQHAGAQRRRLSSVPATARSALALASVLCSVYAHMRASAEREVAVGCSYTPELSAYTNRRTRHRATRQRSTASFVPKNPGYLVPVAHPQTDTLGRQVRTHAGLEPGQAPPNRTKSGRILSKRALALRFACAHT